MSTRTWEAYAMRYATVTRKRQENFIAYDPHDAATHMDYFVWFLKSDNETILVDTGFNAEAARARNRTFLRCPIASFPAVGGQPQRTERAPLPTVKRSSWAGLILTTG